MELQTESAAATLVGMKAAPWIIAVASCLVATLAVLTRPPAPVAAPIPVQPAPVQPAPAKTDPLAGDWVIVEHVVAKRVGRNVTVSGGVAEIEGIGNYEIEWIDAERMKWGPLGIVVRVDIDGDTATLNDGDVSRWQRRRPPAPPARR